MGAESGRGFGYRELKGITDIMREVDKADPYTMMSDLNQTLRAFTDIGMAQGVQDAKEFGRRFKKMSETVRDIARSMGTTMEDATAVFSNMRQAGFVSGSDVIANTRQMQVLGGLGMSRDQFFGAQQQGAGISRSASMSGTSGARQISGIATHLLNEVESGRITGERLMDITGAATPADAAEALGRDFLQSQISFFEGDAGGAVLAAFGTKKDGKFTGGLDRAALQEFIQGGGNLQNAPLRGRPRLDGRGAASSFSARRKDIASEFLESPESIHDIAQLFAQSDSIHRGDEDILLMITEQLTGLDHLRSDLLLETIDTWAEGRRETTEKTMREITAETFRRERAERASLAGVKQLLKGTVADVLIPLKEEGDAALVELDEIGQGILDLALGVNRPGVAAGEMDAGMRALVSGQALPTGITETAATRTLVQQEIRASGRATTDRLGKLIKRPAADLDRLTSTLRADPEIQGMLEDAAMGSKSQLRWLRNRINTEMGGDALGAIGPDVSYVLSGLGSAGELLAAQAPGTANNFYGRSESRKTYLRQGGLEEGDLAVLSAMESAGLSVDGPAFQDLMRAKVREGVVGEDAVLGAVSQDLQERGISTDPQTLRRLRAAASTLGTGFTQYKKRALGALTRDAQVALAAGSAHTLAESGLLSTTLKEELTDVRMVLATGTGDFGKAFRKVLEEEADLSGLAGHPVVSSLIGQRTRLRGLPSTGMVSQQELAEALDMTTDELSGALGSQLTVAAGGGITADEAKDLFSSVAGGRFSVLAAAGGGEMEFRSGMLDRISTVNDSVNKTNESVDLLHQQISASTPVAGTNVTPTNEVERP